MAATIWAGRREESLPLDVVPSHCQRLMFKISVNNLDSLDYSE